MRKSHRAGRSRGMYYNGYDGAFHLESMKRLKDEFGVDKAIICSKEYTCTEQYTMQGKWRGTDTRQKIDYANQLQRYPEALHGLKTLYWYCLQLNCFV